MEDQFCLVSIPSDRIRDVAKPFQFASQDFQALPILADLARALHARDLLGEPGMEHQALQVVGLEDLGEALDIKPPTNDNLELDLQSRA
jgi:hypothetical protein